MRYCLLVPFPLWALIDSTSYSLNPLIRSGGGLVLFGPCMSFSLYGVRRQAWKMLWTFHCFGRVRLYVTGPMTCLIRKGPSCLGASFLDGSGILRFFDSNQTFCPSLNGLE